MTKLTAWIARVAWTTFRAWCIVILFSLFITMWELLSIYDDERFISLFDDEEWYGHRLPVINREIVDDLYLPEAKMLTIGVSMIRKLAILIARIMTHWPFPYRLTADEWRDLADWLGGKPLPAERRAYLKAKING